LLIDVQHHLVWVWILQIASSSLHGGGVDEQHEVAGAVVYFDVSTTGNPSYGSKVDQVDE